MDSSAQCISQKTVTQLDAVGKACQQTGGGARSGIIVGRETRLPAR